MLADSLRPTKPVRAGPEVGTQAESTLPESSGKSADDSAGKSIGNTPHLTRSSMRGHAECEASSLAIVTALSDGTIC